MTPIRLQSRAVPLWGRKLTCIMSDCPPRLDCGPKSDNCGELRTTPQLRGTARTQCQACVDREEHYSHAVCVFLAVCVGMPFALLVRGGLPVRRYPCPPLPAVAAAATPTPNSDPKGECTPSCPSIRTKTCECFSYFQGRGGRRRPTTIAPGRGRDGGAARSRWRPEQWP